MQKIDAPNKSGSEYNGRAIVETAELSPSPFIPADHDRDTSVEHKQIVLRNTALGYKSNRSK